jgi:hypothetical protein
LANFLSRLEVRFFLLVLFERVWLSNGVRDDDDDNDGEDWLSDGEEEAPV